MDPFMRLVKIFVVVAGVLLVGGTITLVALLIARGTGSSSDEPTTSPATSVTDQVAPYALELHAGGEITAITPIGELLAVQTSSSEQQMVIIIDPINGREVGRIELNR